MRAMAQRLKRALKLEVKTWNNENVETMSNRKWIRWSCDTCVRTFASCFVRNSTKPKPRCFFAVALRGSRQLFTSPNTLQEKSGDANVKWLPSRRVQQKLDCWERVDNLKSSFTSCSWASNGTFRTQIFVETSIDESWCLRFDAVWREPITTELGYITQCDSCHHNMHTAYCVSLVDIFSSTAWPSMSLCCIIFRALFVLSLDSKSTKP